MNRRNMFKQSRKSEQYQRVSVGGTETLVQSVFSVDGSLNVGLLPQGFMRDSHIGLLDKDCILFILSVLKIAIPNTSALTIPIHVSSQSLTAKEYRNCYPSWIRLIIIDSALQILGQVTLKAPIIQSLYFASGLPKAPPIISRFPFEILLPQNLLYHLAHLL